MPILKHLPEVIPTDGLARIGKLHKGGPKRERTKNGETYQIVGEDLDHFRVEFAEGYEELEPIFADLYGKEPKQIPFQLNADTALQAFDFWYEDYDSKGTLLHRCDGSKQAICYNKTTGFHESNMPCAIPNNGCSCKQVGRLALYLTEFIDLTGVLGTITMETHSDHDIRTILARLTTYANMFGTLRGVPLILIRAPKQVSAPKTDKGKRTGERTKITRSLIDIQVAPEFTKSRIRAALNGQFNSDRALPHTIDAVVSQDDVQLALSSGSRRIDAPALPAPATDPMPAPHWTTDAKAWKGFTDWAGMYGCKPLDVLDALEEAAESPIENPSDWTGDKTRAMGAVIARVCDYSLERIAKYVIKSTGPKNTLTSETQSAIRADATAIATARHNALAQAAEDVSAAAPSDAIENQS